VRRKAPKISLANHEWTAIGDLALMVGGVAFNNTRIQRTSPNGEKKRTIHCGRFNRGKEEVISPKRLGPPNRGDAQSPKKREKGGGSLTKKSPRGSRGKLYVTQSPVQKFLEHEGEMGEKSRMPYCRGTKRWKNQLSKHNGLRKGVDLQKRDKRSRARKLGARGGKKWSKGPSLLLHDRIAKQ